MQKGLRSSVVSKDFLPQKYSRKRKSGPLLHFLKPFCFYLKGHSREANRNKEEKENEMGPQLDLNK